MRRFLQKPGSASLDRYEELLPDIAARGRRSCASSMTPR